jgi:hypothetical protein
MSWVGFEPTIPAFERAKTVHALNRATNVIGLNAGILTKTKFDFESAFAFPTSSYDLFIEAYEIDKA